MSIYLAYKYKIVNQEISYSLPLTSQQGKVEFYSKIRFLLIPTIQPEMGVRKGKYNLMYKLSYKLRRNC